MIDALQHFDALVRPGELMTQDDAKMMQGRARSRGAWILWLVSTMDPQVVAWAMTNDLHGGVRLPGMLVADTLDELRALLPAGLKRSDRTSTMPAEVVETWD